MSAYLLKLSCKAFVKQWLIKEFGNPVQLPKKHQVRQVIETMLSREYHRAFKSSRDTETVEIQITQSLFDKIGHSLSEAHRSRLCAYLEKYIKVNMLSMVNNLRVSGYNTREAINEYRALYGFTDEIFSEDAAVQSYYREQKKLFQILSQLKQESNV